MGPPDETLSPQHFDGADNAGGLDELPGLDDASRVEAPPRVEDPPVETNLDNLTYSSNKYRVPKDPADFDTQKCLNTIANKRMDGLLSDRQSTTIDGPAHLAMQTAKADLTTLYKAEFIKLDSLLAWSRD